MLIVAYCYVSVAIGGWLVDTDITPHIPVWDKSAREDGTFSRAGFSFDKERTRAGSPIVAFSSTWSNIQPSRSAKHGCACR